MGCIVYRRWWLPYMGSLSPKPGVVGTPRHYVFGTFRVFSVYWFELPTGGIGWVPIPRPRRCLKQVTKLLRFVFTKACPMRSMVSDMPCPKALSSLIVVLRTGLAPLFLSSGDGTLTLRRWHPLFLEPGGWLQPSSSLSLSLLFFPSYFRLSLARVSVGY
jgi:hypothetical protein